MTGRPPYKWTPEIEAEIFARISKGEALHRICNDDWLPSDDTFYRRVDADAEFRDRYMRARDRQADRFFDEISEIVDTTTPETAHVARLRMDARKWMAGKLRPKVYGEKATTVHENPDGSAITFIVRDMTKEG